MKVFASLFSIAFFTTLVFVPGLSAADNASDPAMQVVAPPSADKIPVVDPIALYGDEILFDVYRKGQKVGEQSMYFSKNATGDLFVQVRFRLAIDVLFFTAYTYSYDASEIWRDNTMIALTSQVDDDGKVAKTSARLEDDVFKIEGPRGTVLASSWVFPTNHWHRGQVESTVILNTLLGTLAHVRVERRGIDKVPTERGDVDAEHFVYTGDLRDTDVWYDAAGRWVKMTFKAKDKSTIEFRCRKCMPTVEG